MSRSYKKNPWAGDNKGKRKKRTANQSVRAWLKQNPEVGLSKSDYKKIYNTWDICDYGSIESWKEYWASEIRLYYWYKANFPKQKIDFPNKKDAYRKWYKMFKMK